MALKEQITTFLEPYLEEGKYFIVDIHVKASKVSQKVMILLDSDEGITIQECADISRALGNDLEASETIDTPYTLEVSSPGLDQPLHLLRQYTKNVGRELKVSLVSGEIVSGTLVEVKESSIVLQVPAPKKKPKVPLEESALRPELPLETIAKAIVQVSFK
ncbi:ribosome maturation factor RimP [Arundinibacter roseus]|uniref:Ribosome maturation factor RimP n=1 Tax=Arundinibacter roseus TaxID=2070510 RepID=A0A4R4KI91_9BACT|nr:ribosome maturation factor RimP [Arundinibacter roseus]TDB67857.1 ribosome maturation factor RimP [Arundinibacter roseus]